jgi:hypothetical protein
MANQLWAGDWSGYTTTNSQNITVANGYGKWEYYNKGRLLFSLTGNATYGQFNGYVVLYIYSDIGTEFFEGYVSDGVPHGKIIINDSKNRIFSTSFYYGNMNDKLRANIPGYRTASFECGQISLKELLSADVMNYCKIENNFNDELFGFATIISAIITLTDDHLTMNDFTNCLLQNYASELIGDPIKAAVASEAINSYLTNNSYSWKTASESAATNYLSKYLNDNGYKSLSNSINFVSSLNCIISKSK